MANLLDIFLLALSNLTAAEIYSSGLFKNCSLVKCGAYCFLVLFIN
nr:MAG TPA: hypothetical protein [Caudoviricetes sp.]DAT29179.1 MAG TPA: hypothetical protein [Caudoviricetes sp.]